jgi:hypothetical protein
MRGNSNEPLVRWGGIHRHGRGQACSRSGLRRLATMAWQYRMLVSAGRDCPVLQRHFLFYGTRVLPGMGSMIMPCYVGLGRSLCCQPCADGLAEKVVVE